MAPTPSLWQTTNIQYIHSPNPNFCLIRMKLHQGSNFLPTNHGFLSIFMRILNSKWNQHFEEVYPKFPNMAMSLHSKHIPIYSGWVSCSLLLPTSVASRQIWANCGARRLPTLTLWHSVQCKMLQCHLLLYAKMRAQQSTQLDIYLSRRPTLFDTGLPDKR